MLAERRRNGVLRKARSWAAFAMSCRCSSSSSSNSNPQQQRQWQSATWPPEQQTKLNCHRCFYRRFSCRCCSCPLPKKKNSPWKPLLTTPPLHSAPFGNMLLPCIACCCRCTNSMLHLEFEVNNS